MNKLNYEKTLLLGFGFFAINITWSVYNSFMPILLSSYIASTALIGFIMTIDNYLAFFIQPAIGAYSDKINTRFGRRMPFLLIGMPLAAICTILIPYHTGLITLILALLGMNLSMSIFRSPVIALMPDLTHKEHRSKANSLINFMGGVGALTAYFIGSLLWKIDYKYPFYLAGVLILISCIVVFAFINEKRDVIEYETAEEKINIKMGLQAAFKDRNTKYLLLAIAAWFIGFNGIETFFTRYGSVYLGLEVSDASLSFAFLSLSVLVFAVPSGIIGTRIGKKKSIMIGIIGGIIGFSILLFLRNINEIRLVFLMQGVCWALINVNSYPFVAEMAPKGYIGTYTGLYYMFSSVANIISPPLLGGIIDIVGYRYMFLYGLFFFAVALCMMARIKEKKPSS
mgnify:CR=1 FL=1